MIIEDEQDLGAPIIKAREVTTLEVKKTNNKNSRFFKILFVDIKKPKMQMLISIFRMH
ncbi:hypothetical protein ACS0TY_021510 [Phlomoides rotata]